MKRVNNLFEKIIDINNILLAHKNASKGKSSYDEVQMFNERPYYYAKKIRKLLKDKKWTPSENRQFDRDFDNGKNRCITDVDYYPDRIIHHAIMQVVEPIFNKVYIKDTYQSIKNRGLHKGVKRVKSWLRDEENTEYCLKVDVEKFYPSLQNHILKKYVRKKIKCKDTLYLLDLIIESDEGLPIGFYPSGPLGNFVVSYLDHYIKKLGAKLYIRYADDIVIFHKSKEFLHYLRFKMQEFLKAHLELSMKNNYQVFPLSKRGLDFLGYRFFRKYTLVRKSIVKKMKRVFRRRKIRTLSDISRVMSYAGWIKHASSYNFQRVFMPLVQGAIKNLSKRLGIKNPLRKLYLLDKPKKIQLTLF